MRMRHRACFHEMLFLQTLNRLAVISSLLRFFLILYGEWQDKHFVVKFTDIDYHVFTDAAKHVTEGASPYLRPTYRYSPLLALLLTPNHYLFFSFGKLLFVVCDLATGWLIYSILSLRGVPEKLKLISCACWLLNPLTATVSSRGNAESLLSVLVLYCLYLVMTKRLLLLAVMFGLSVHMKIFPIMYALPLFLLLDNDYACYGGTDKKTRTLLDVLWGLLTKERLKFTAVSAGTFLLTTLLCYLWCGDDLVQEGYLYHVTRRDTRHNFSVYFYMLYLIQDTWLSLPVGILSFLPQAILLLGSSLWLYRDISFCCFVQTFTFVTFNKVCTSQYFLWYLCLLPLILPFSKLRIKDAVSMTTLWFIGQGLWLAPAYLLEFQGYNTFLLIWAAGLVFFCINVYILVRIIRNHKFVPTFSHGQITCEHKQS